MVDKSPVCRFCLCEGETLVWIFREHCTQTIVPAEVLTDILQIQVWETDTFPKFCCLKCFDHLADIKQFRDECLKSLKTYQCMQAAVALQDEAVHHTTPITVKGKAIEEEKSPEKVVVLPDIYHNNGEYIHVTESELAAVSERQMEHQHGNPMAEDFWKTRIIEEIVEGDCSAEEVIVPDNKREIGECTQTTIKEERAIVEVSYSEDEDHNGGECSEMNKKTSSRSQLESENTFLERIEGMDEYIFKEEELIISPDEYSEDGEEGDPVPEIEPIVKDAGVVLGWLPEYIIKTVKEESPEIEPESEQIASADMEETNQTNKENSSVNQTESIETSAERIEGMGESSIKEEELIISNDDYSEDDEEGDPVSEIHKEDPIPGQGVSVIWSPDYCIKVKSEPADGSNVLEAARQLSDINTEEAEEEILEVANIDTMGPSQSREDSSSVRMQRRNILGDNLPQEVENLTNAKTKKSGKQPRFSSTQQLVCDLCSKCFQNKMSLSKHIINHSHRRHLQQEKHVKLSRCKNSLVKFNLSHCSIKNKTLRGGSISKNHFRAHTAIKSYVCSGCKKRFSCSKTLKVHLRTHSNKNPYTCSECCKAFLHMTSLKRHLRTHTNERLYTCTDCNKGFLYLSYLKEHLRTHTNERPYICTECNKAFSHLNSLKRHLRTHTNERPYTCTECNKTFAQGFTLKRHLRTHTNERPYTCFECNKAFSHSDTLKGHLRSHTNERPYTCSECNKAFLHLSNLITHHRTHSNERPYTCPECNKGFSHSPHLKRHIRTHIKERKKT